MTPSSVMFSVTTNFLMLMPPVSVLFHEDRVWHADSSQAEPKESICRQISVRSKLR